MDVWCKLPRSSFPQAIYSGEIPFPLRFLAVVTLSGRSFSEFIQHLRDGIAGTAARVIRTIHRRWHTYPVGYPNNVVRIGVGFFRKTR